VSLNVHTSCTFSVHWISDSESVIFGNDDLGGVTLLPRMNGGRR